MKTMRSTQNTRTAGKRVLVWEIDVDTKFVFFTDRFGYITRIQMMNRKTEWVYEDLNQRKYIGKIKALDFIKLYSAYFLPADTKLHPRPYFRIVTF